MQPADCPNPKVYGDTQTKLLSKEKSNTILAYLVRVKAKNNQNKNSLTAWTQSLALLSVVVYSVKGKCFFI